jgi:hypothetical protein
MAMGKDCQTQARNETLGTSFRRSSRHVQIARSQYRFSRCAGLPFCFLLFLLTASACHAQSRDVVCRDGQGEFDAEFLTGVRAHVGAERILELASRACNASLRWGDQSLIVASATAELDIDAFGVDLGIGAAVAAFQVKKSKAECCREYKIYSLRNPPTLLRSITGGDFFSAADTDLDGRVEIWSDDAAAAAGFEDIRLGDLDFAPPVILRFQHGKLLDASAEFQPYFDQKISDERAKLAPQDLADFKSSDGKLDPLTAKPDDRAKRLQTIKMRVLEIVWSFLYSGRENEAWRSLAELWPPADFNRIREALLKMRSRGILSQVDGASAPIPAGRQIRTKIFDATTTVVATPGLTPKDVKPKQEIVTPRAILMEREPPTDVYEAELMRAESMLKLVIDSAGKVRSVEVMGAGQPVDEGLIKSTSNWKFIPAFNGSEPVASQIFLGVSLKR